MPQERLQKLDPRRTIHLRGFDRRGAAAAIHHASETGFRVSGVFRSPDDFAVVTLFKRDNLFEHHTIRHLPDGDLRGVKLQFDYAPGDGVAPLDSTFYESIPNRSLSYIRNDRSSGTIPLFDHATLQSEAFPAAKGVFHFVAGEQGPRTYDRVIIWYLNLAFEYSATGANWVEYAFFNAGGTGAQHSITTPTKTYVYTQQGGDGSGDVANRMVELVNAGEGDPDVVASIGSSFHIVRLTARQAGGEAIVTSAVDGGGIAGAASLTLHAVGLETYPIQIAQKINTFNWEGAGPSLGLIASADGAELEIKPARYGRVNVDGDGVTVRWASGGKFQGLTPGAEFCIEGERLPIEAVLSAVELRLAAPGVGGARSGARYLAERGGADGNFIELRRQSLRPRGGVVDVADRTVSWKSGDDFSFLTAGRSMTIGGAEYGIASIESPTSLTLASSAPNQTNSPFAATEEDNPEIITEERTVRLTGGSSDVVWRVALDFSALGIDDPFEAWLTLAPPLTFAADLPPTEFDLTITNWQVDDPEGRRPLQVAGPGSVRVTNGSSWATYEGSGWTEEAGFYDLGFARASSTGGDRVRIFYACQQTHDLYIGTRLSADGGIAEVSLDGDATTELDTFFAVEPPHVTVRRVRTAVPAGQHTVTLTVAGRGAPGSVGQVFYLDHLEAVVAGDVDDPPERYARLSAATDYDTDATYKLPPQRLLFQLQRLGYLGTLNHFVGNFFHYERRKRAGTGKRGKVQVEFGGIWRPNEAVILRIGGVPVGKTIFPGEGPAEIVEHLAFFINTTFVGVFAEVAGETLVIKNRANLYEFSFEVDEAGTSSVDGTATASGSLAKGSEGIWEIDDSSNYALNYAAREWHRDLFEELEAAGIAATAAYNLEGYNPPDSDSAAWAARFYDGRPVRTAVGFGSEAEGAVVGATASSPIELRVERHGYETGDEILVAGVGGVSGANGTFLITVVDEDRFTLDGSQGGGSYSGGGLARRSLKTTHLAPNPVVSAFLERVYRETADLGAAASVDLTLQLGEVLWWFFSDRTQPLSSVTASAPIRLWAGGHGYQTGDEVIVAGVGGVPQANGTWRVTALDENRLELQGSDGSAAGADVSGQGQLVGGSMAFYDAETRAAAQAALGRPLTRFTCQDCDPAVNGGADADFLRDRLESHLERIVAYVRQAHPGTKFELLYPFDVLHPESYHTLDLPYPQGGRLNHHVSTPEIWKRPADPQRRLKIEALSWGAFYRNLNRARESMSLWKGPRFEWPAEAVTYLLPWFNSGSPWEREYLLALEDGPAHLAFWALDHKRLFEWRGFPQHERRSRFLG